MPGEDHASLVQKLAPPTGTSLVFVGDSTGDGTLGTGLVVRLSNGRFALGGEVADRDAPVEESRTFEELVEALKSS